MTIGAGLPVGHLEALPEWARRADAGPFRPGGPEVLVGGFAPAALARVGRFGDGLLCAAPPAWAAGLFAAVARSWVEHGRSGAPRNVAARRLDDLAIHQSRLTFVETYGDGGWGLLGDPSRRAIFELLARRPARWGAGRSSCRSAGRRCPSTCGCSRTAAWSSATAEGTRRVYRLNPDGVAALRAWLDRVWADALAGFHKAAEAAPDDPEQEDP